MKTYKVTYRIEVCGTMELGAENLQDAKGFFSDLVDDEDSDLFSNSEMINITELNIKKVKTDGAA